MIRLMIRINEGRGKKFACERFPLSIGRSADNGLPIADAHVSSHHCVIEQEHDTFRILDCHSRCGTKLNGTQVASSTLKPGDSITIGRTVITIECLGTSMPERRLGTLWRPPALIAARAKAEGEITQVTKFMLFPLPAAHHIEDAPPTGRQTSVTRIVRPAARKISARSLASAGLVIAATPWWLVSLLLHAMLLVMTSLWVVHIPAVDKDQAVILADIVCRNQMTYHTTLKRDITRVPKNLPDETVIDDPVAAEDIQAADLEIDDPAEEISTRGHRDAVITTDIAGQGWTAVWSAGDNGLGAYGWRGGGKRTALVRNGGSEATEAAVEAALQWFKRHQAREGSWSMHRYQEACTGRPSCPFHDILDTYAARDQLALDDYPHWWDNCATGLALLCFLGNGSTHQQGRYRDQVADGLAYLVRSQAHDGAFAEFSYWHDANYVHAIAAMAVTEAYGMTRDPALKPVVRKAIQVILRRQNDHLAWDYAQTSSRNDTSVTGWQVMALKAAVAAGIDIGDAFDGARRFFDRITPPVLVVGAPLLEDHCAYTFYADRDDPGHRNSTCTAISLLCRILMGEPVTDNTLKAHANMLVSALPESYGDGDFYRWYYTTLAMFQMGGGYWKTWNAALKDVLLANQAVAGCADGSWAPTADWSCQRGGRLFATAMGCLSLEAYYRFVPFTMLAAAETPKENTPAVVTLTGKVRLKPTFRQTNVTLVTTGRTYTVFDWPNEQKLTAWNGRRVTVECRLIGGNRPHVIDKILAVTALEPSRPAGTNLFGFPCPDYTAGFRFGGNFGLYVPADYDSPFADSYHLAEDTWFEGGTPVFSVGEGTVMFSGFVPTWTDSDGRTHWGMGNVIVIEYPLTPAENGLEAVCAVYMHLSHNRGVTAGDEVKRGQVIGYIGANRSDENGIYPAHLHFGLHRGVYYQLTPGIRQAITAQARTEGFLVRYRDDGSNAAWVEIPGAGGRWRRVTGEVGSIVQEGPDRARVTLEDGTMTYVPLTAAIGGPGSSEEVLPLWCHGYGDRQTLAEWLKPSTWLKSHMAP